MAIWVLIVAGVLIAGRILILAPVVVVGILAAVLLLGSYFAFAIVGGVADCLWRGFLKVVNC